MSVWAAGVWAAGVWAPGVWFEDGAVAAPAANTPSVGGDDAITLFWTLRKERKSREAMRRLEAERGKAAVRQAEEAQRDFDAVVKAQPEAAKEITKAHAVNLGPRYEVMWDKLIADAVVMEALHRTRIELEDEEALIILLAADL